MGTSTLFFIVAVAAFGGVFLFLWLLSRRHGSQHNKTDIVLFMATITCSTLCMVSLIVGIVLSGLETIAVIAAVVCAAAGSALLVFGRRTAQREIRDAVLPPTRHARRAVRKFVFAGMFLLVLAAVLVGLLVMDVIP